MPRIWNIEPELLLLPTIPEPLHGVNPRTVLGVKWWNAERKEAYASTNQHCKACGVHKDQAKFKQWLEGHEVYHTNYEAGLLIYERTVPLCRACHSFIHQGRLGWLLRTQQISIQRFTAIQRHGLSVLSKIGKTLEDKPIGDETLVPVEEWRLVINGIMYKGKLQTVARFYVD